MSEAAANSALWLISLVSFTWAAYRDWKTRQVPNKHWTVTLAICSPFLVYELTQHPALFAWRLLALPWALAMLLLWRAKSFGGADAKALMLCAVALTPALYYDPLGGRVYPALDILIVAFLLNETWRRLTKTTRTPFMVPMALAAWLTFFLGSLVWWPFVFAARLIQAG